MFCIPGGMSCNPGKRDMVTWLLKKNNKSINIEKIINVLGKQAETITLKNLIFSILTYKFIA